MKITSTGYSFLVDNVPRFEKVACVLSKGTSVENSANYYLNKPENITLLNDNNRLFVNSSSYALVEEPNNNSLLIEYFTTKYNAQEIKEREIECSFFNNNKKVAESMLNMRR